MQPAYFSTSAAIFFLVTQEYALAIFFGLSTILYVWLGLRYRNRALRRQLEEWPPRRTHPPPSLPE